MRYILALLLLLLQPVNAEEWEFEIVQLQQEVKASKEYYVVMFTAQWCSSCRTSKRNDMPKLLLAMPESRELDVDLYPEWIKPKRIRFVSGTVDHKGIYNLPTYWLVEKDSDGTESVVKEWVGVTKPDTILSTISKPAVDKPNIQPNVVESATYSIYNGKRGSSHENRTTLINHLMYEGIHARKHNLASLNKMTDNELDELHNNDHSR